MVIRSGGRPSQARMARGAGVQCGSAGKPVVRSSCSFGDTTRVIKKPSVRALVVFGRHNYLSCLLPLVV
jgi:hypothetical protein